MREPSFPDLRTFLDALRRRGELVEVRAPVSARLEIAEIHRRVIAAGGPALLFTAVEGAAHACATNLFGTPERARLAFGERPFRLLRELVSTAQAAAPPSLGTLWRGRRSAAALLRIGTRSARSAPVTEVVTRDVDLSRLPILTTWPEDGGPFVTLPLVYTEHPETGGHNLGIYRMQVHDRRTTGMHWQIAKGGGFHHAAAEARGESLPVTVFLGGPPALLLAAVAPLPENVPELLLASLLLGERLELRRGSAAGGPHPLVARAEIALCGRVPPRVRRDEGPFGDHYGYYSLRHPYPVFEIEAIAHRRDAIYPATIVGKPRQEDFFIGDLLQELLSPLFPLVMPGVEALWSYGETGYHSLAAAIVRERYERESLVSAFRILGEGQLALTKFLLLTDRPVDLRDFRATLEHVLARTRPETDLYVLPDTSMDTLDYSGARVNRGSKGVLAGLGDPVRDLPRELSAAELPRGVRAVEVFCPGCLVIEGASKAEEPELGERIASHPAFSGWPLLVLSDEAKRAAKSAINFLWTTFTRFEPAADIGAARRTLARNRVVFEPPITIDARLRPGFPGELHASPEIAERVTRRWREYFPSGVEMGDAEAAHLDP
ncbi:MAG TPA: UbiD family decarboxylase [Thermoanaerobaculia bacterium]|nr:UbiD family decarboxylase [Thermoanaerobaculia bacterium]